MHLSYRLWHKGTCFRSTSQAIWSAAPGHKNDDWCHVEHTYICYGDCHRFAAYRRQTRNQNTDTGCQVQKTLGPSEAWMHESANKGETKEIQLPWAAWPYVWTNSIKCQNHPILETKKIPKNMHKSARGRKTEAINLSHRGSHWRWCTSTPSTQKTSGPMLPQRALQ